MQVVYHWLPSKKIAISKNRYYVNDIYPWSFDVDGTVTSPKQGWIDCGDTPRSCMTLSVLLDHGQSPTIADLSFVTQEPCVQSNKMHRQTHIKLWKAFHFVASTTPIHCGRMIVSVVHLFWMNVVGLQYVFLPRRLLLEIVPCQGLDWAGKI